MEALIGIIIGVVATVVVGRYYFNRTVNKRLTPYLTLSTQIFAGIEETVRQELKFTFRGTEVSDLHQLEFLIANDGERAVSSPIEPLTLELPKEVQVLDASILHRHPSSLKAEISEVNLVDNKKRVGFQISSSK
jgi:Tfp pilus assembly protein PilN